jgi:hypothetical protein
METNELKQETNSNNRTTDQTTGNMFEETQYSIMDVIFEKYVISVVLNSNNQFVGIAEVKETKDFLSQKQRLAIKSFINTDEYYRE